MCTYSILFLHDYWNTDTNLERERQTNKSHDKKRKKEKERNSSFLLFSPNSSEIDQNNHFIAS